MSAPAERARAYTITVEQIRALGPCANGGSYADVGLPADGEFTALEAREMGCTIDHMVWAVALIARADGEMVRRLRHWATDCVAHVAPIYQAAFPQSATVRAAVAATHAFIEQPDDKALGLARVSACLAARDDGINAMRAGWRAAASVAIAAADAGYFTPLQHATAWPVSRAAGAAKAYGGFCAWQSERAWQYDRLVAWLGNGEMAPMGAAA